MTGQLMVHLHRGSDNGSRRSTRPLEANVEWSRLGTLATQTAGKRDILGLDGHTLGMNGGQVGVLEQGDQVSLGSLLKSANGGRLESEISLKVLSNLTNETLEGEFSDEQLSRLLVATNLTKSDGTRLVTVWLLDTTGSGGRFTGGFGGKLLTGCFTTSGLSGCLLSTSHLAVDVVVDG